MEPRKQLKPNHCTPNSLQASASSNRVSPQTLMMVLVGMLEFDGSATADCLAKVILKIPMSFWQENTTNISGKAFQKAGFQDDDGWSRSGCEINQLWTQLKEKVTEFFLTTCTVKFNVRQNYLYIIY